MASIWETRLTDDATQNNSYKVAKPGEYVFQVEKATGKEYTPKLTSKIKKCAEIDLQLRVETPEGDVRVFDRLYSDPTTIWKMTSFAKCIGVFRSGMTPGDLLKACNGAIGKAYIKLSPATAQYAERNEVGRYIEKSVTDQNEDLPF